MATQARHREKLQKENGRSQKIKSGIRKFKKREKKKEHPGDLDFNGEYKNKYP